ncbi:hypothetical protein OTU49_002332 [Cherax quadricarinatus]|uniref:Uncharacterized protein n=1 Tax=Cherax quadricarinatus TaxID=27406 RepID=A0AAW0YMX5_CHEQU
MYGNCSHSNVNTVFVYRYISIIHRNMHKLLTRITQKCQTNIITFLLLIYITSPLVISSNSDSSKSWTFVVQFMETKLLSNVCYFFNNSFICTGRCASNFNN